jgi:hypothetical protein
MYGLNEPLTLLKAAQVRVCVYTYYEVYGIYLYNDAQYFNIYIYIYMYLMCVICMVCIHACM